MGSDQEWSASFAQASKGAMSYYDDIMVPRLFDPWAHLLLDKVDPKSGQDVIDVACGPGTVTRLAARRVGLSGTVTGCDLSPAMLDLDDRRPRWTPAHRSSTSNVRPTRSTPPMRPLTW